MDVFSLLMNARIVDIDDGEYGEVIAVHYANGRLTLVLCSEYDEDDEDDPSREPIPVEELGAKIRALGNKKAG